MTESAESSNPTFWHPADFSYLLTFNPSKKTDWKHRLWIFVYLLELKDVLVKYMYFVVIKHLRYDGFPVMMVKFPTFFSRAGLFWWDYVWTGPPRSQIIARSPCDWRDFKHVRTFL